MSDIKRFYKDRAQSIKTDWKRFDYDENGNMVMREKDDAGQYTVVQTIARPVYRPLTYEERDTMERKRQEAIATAIQTFETARHALYDAVRARSDTSFKNESNLLSLNRAVQEAEYELSRIRFPLREIIKEEKIEIRKLDPLQPTETRKYPYPIAIMKTFPFSLQDYYVREGESVAPLQSVAEIQLQEKQAEPIILFSTPDTNAYGYLSLEWAVDLEFQQTAYHSATQAVYAELAKALGDETNRQKIMLARSPLQIHYTAEQIPEFASLWKENLTRLLYEVNLHKFTRYPDLQAMLLQTGNAILGAYLPNDVLLGIGISLDREESKKKMYWTGENLLGKALMEVRQVLRNQSVSSLQAPAKEITKARRIRPKRIVNGAIVAAAPTEAVAALPPAQATTVAPQAVAAAPTEAVAALPPAQAVAALPPAQATTAAPTEAVAAPQAVSARRVIRRPISIKLNP